MIRLFSNQWNQQRIYHEQILICEKCVKKLKFLERLIEGQTKI